VSHKCVYYFGPDGADGDAGMKSLLGGKGANLAEMARLGLPVPAGFTITTDVCTHLMNSGGRYPEGLEEQVAEALGKVEAAMGMKYGDPDNPLLLSTRSGARISMPGMMETVLNVGLCSATIAGLVRKSRNERFVHDAYRRLIAMYSDVVIEKSEGIAPAEGRGIRLQLEQIMDRLQEEKGCQQAAEMTAEDLKSLCEEYKKKVKEVLGTEFPDDAQTQLWGAIGAVFKSWAGKRAVSYRRIEGIPHEWGTATTVQSMVFGNLGKRSATGVAFTRNPATGENKLYGEWLVDAQGEDVVAGIRTPNPLSDDTKSRQNQHLPSLQQAMPELYRELEGIRTRLEAHYRDMQDIEFTIQDGKLYMLQCRSGKRTGSAAVNMALAMLSEGLIDEKTAVMRVSPAHLEDFLHPMADPIDEEKQTPVAWGLPAGPGVAVGQIVFNSKDADKWARQGKRVILVADETSPEDIEGMRAAEGILTARGGMTSHAGLVARGWGKCCIVGAGQLTIDLQAKTMTVGGKTFREGDVLTLNGTKGLVYDGALRTMRANENPRLAGFMRLMDEHRKVAVRANADVPEDAKLARELDADGIGLFRTEHVFYGADAEEPLFFLRKVVHAGNEQERKKAIDELVPFVKHDIKVMLAAMDGLPVTVRLLDPPLHEFVAQHEATLAELAKALGTSVQEVRKRGELLREVNPMMGHRGVRLGMTCPELIEMQIRALFEAAAELQREGGSPRPELLVPTVCDQRELARARVLFDRVQKEVEREFAVDLSCPYGAMIEIPRACLLADQIARTAEFFCFGTNDLTQMGFGFSRDDVGGFLRHYQELAVLEADPFQTIDRQGVGQLIQIAVAKGRSTRPDLQVGVCGEVAADPASIDFFCSAGLDYVSCSPYRIPIARLAAAQASIAIRSN
jgi:pyruvate,orthophosphate dikinase